MGWQDDLLRVVAKLDAPDRGSPTEDTPPTPGDSLAVAPRATNSETDKPLEDRAEALAHRMLDRLQEANDRGDIDADDAMQALPVLQRIREHADRMELQRADDKSKLPVINFSIQLGHRIQIGALPVGEAIEATGPVSRMDALPVVDATPAQTKPLVFELEPNLTEAEGDSPSQEAAG